MKAAAPSPLLPATVKPAVRLGTDPRAGCVRARTRRARIVLGLVPSFVDDDASSARRATASPRARRARIQRPQWGVYDAGARAPRTRYALGRAPRDRADAGLYSSMPNVPRRFDIALVAGSRPAGLSSPRGNEPLCTSRSRCPSSAINAPICHVVGHARRCALRGAPRVLRPRRRHSAGRCRPASADATPCDRTGLSPLVPARPTVMLAGPQ